MAYPSTYDTGQVQPFALYDGEPASGVASVGVANTVYLVGVTLQAYITVTGVRVRFGTGGTGHYDVGIYDSSGINKAPGNLLAHAASSGTALATATGAQTPALIGGNLQLAPGNYWLALWIDNATDTIVRIAGTAQMEVLQSGTVASGPLPSAASSISGLANAQFKPILEAILQGSWS